jgi:hypothetical protein
VCHERNFSDALRPSAFQTFADLGIILKMLALEPAGKSASNFFEPSLLTRFSH